MGCGVGGEGGECMLALRVGGQEGECVWGRAEAGNGCGVGTASIQTEENVGRGSGVQVEEHVSAVTTT